MAENSATVEAKDSEPEKTNQSGSRSRKRAPSPSLNMDELRELAELVNEHGFTDFEFENENIRVRLSKQTSPSAAGQPVQYAQIPQPLGAMPATTTQSQVAAPDASEES